MKITMLICAVAGALSISTAAVAATTDVPIPSGSYQDTCSDIEATWTTLTATCERRDGNWNYTTLSGYRQCDGDIANVNGRLKCVDDEDDNDDWLPRGSYRETCRKIEVDDNTLEAECKDNFGRWRYTELADYRSCRGDIFNDRGILRCRRDSDDVGMPGGNWRASCRNARLYGSVLYAECRDFLRRWRATSLDLRRCSGNVSNVRGRLTCSSGGGAGGGGDNYARITLFRNSSYSGQSRTFVTDVPDLNTYGIGNQASSILIESGVWQVCDRPYFGGYCIVLDRSQPSLFAFSFNDRAESIRRMR